MFVAIQSPVVATDAGQCSSDRTPLWQQLRRLVMVHRENFGQRAIASAVRQLDHPGVLADYEASRQGF